MAQARSTVLLLSLSMLALVSALAACDAGTTGAGDAGARADIYIPPGVDASLDARPDPMGNDTGIACGALGPAFRPDGPCAAGPSFARWNVRDVRWCR